jgi:hypothetical protein
MDKRVWLTPRALKLHAVILVVVPGFMALCIWQLSRALGGNELSWAYVFEWPFFAAYAFYMWWRFVHEAPDAAVAASSRTPDALGEPQPQLAPGQGAADNVDAGAPGRSEANANKSDEEAELAAYNEYLAQLAARDKAVGR